MSKKVQLLLFCFAPTIIGYIHNMLTGWIITSPISFIFTIYWYSSPILMAYFWFWVGGRFAQSNIKIFFSIIFGHIIGVISLCVYFWQFIYTSDSQRLPRIASLSLMFSSNISIAIAKLGYYLNQIEMLLVW